MNFQCRTLKDDVLECIDYTKQEGNVEFIWNRDLSKKFIWSFKNNYLSQKQQSEYILNSKFKSSTNNNKIQLKIQFEIKDIGISSIEIQNDNNNDNNNVNMIKTVKNVRSGEFIVR